MRRLGLVAILFAMAFAYSALTWRGEQGGAGSPKVLGSGLPVGFTSWGGGHVERKIKALYSVEASEKFHSDAWPFTRQRINFACAEGMLNIVQSDGRYAALNGYTSTLAKRYKVVNDRGEAFHFLGTSANQILRDGGIVRADAQDAAIGGWWGALNNRLGRECR